MTSATVERLINAGFSVGMASRLLSCVDAEKASASTLEAMGFPVGQSVYLKTAITAANCSAPKLASHGMNFRQAVVLSDMINSLMPIADVKPSIPSDVSNLRVGSIIAVSLGKWRHARYFKIQWLADGIPLDRSTSQFLDVREQHIGKKLSCRVTGVNYNSETAETTAEVGPVNP